MIKLIIFYMMLHFLKAYLFNRRIARELATCSGYSSCSQCQIDSSCTFLNSICTTQSSSTLTTDTFDYANESKYCNNGSSKNITLSKISGSTLTLYQNSKFDIAAHSTCFWSILTNAGVLVTIQVNRSTSNFENIDVSAYDSKSIVSDKNSKQLFELKRLNSNSNYTVTVSHQTSNKSVLSIILLVFLLISIIIAVIGWIGCFIILIIFSSVRGVLTKTRLKIGIIELNK